MPEQNAGKTYITTLLNKQKSKFQSGTLQRCHLHRRVTSLAGQLASGTKYLLLVQ